MLAHLRCVAESHSTSVLSPGASRRAVGNAHASASVRTSVKKSRSQAVRRMSTKSRARSCLCGGAVGACAIHTQVRTSVAVKARVSRTYMSGGASDAGGEKPSKSGGAGQNAPTGAAGGAGAKKMGNTSSTLSNLENLYAAFAKQQKEKAKATEQKDVDKDQAARGSHVADRRQEQTMTSDDPHLQAAYDMEADPEGMKMAPTFFESLEPGSLFADASLAQTPRPGIHVLEKGKKVNFEMLRANERQATLQEMKDMVGHFDDSATASKRPRRAPRTLAELRAQEEEQAIIEGRLDPVSPAALEMKKRNQPIVPKSENEARMIETALIDRHRAAVEQVAHVEKELDISATVPGMAPLTHSQNPYLFNEAYQLGLTDAEVTWLRTRETWNNLVAGKRTSLALLQRDMKEDRDMVDDLFIKVVNRLSGGPASGSWIHPEDLKAQQLALEARTRLRDRLWDIYKHNPMQWASLVHKYVPTVKEDKMADRVMDPWFWSPTNPWLLTAFTKQLVDEAQLIEKTMGESPLEEEIEQRMVDQGQLRSDDVTDSLEIGPLGQTHGGNIEEDAEASMNDPRSQQNLGCLFCSVHRHRFPLDPMNVPLLARHMTMSGEILPRTATGLCKRHQAKMAKTIKQARHLNLFVYKHSEYRINNLFKDSSNWTPPDVDKVVYTDPLVKADTTKHDEKMSAFMKHMTRHDDEETEAALLEADSRIDREYAQIRATARGFSKDADIRTEELNEPPMDPAIMASIESMATMRADSRARHAKEREESSAAFQRASRANRKSATASFQKGNRNAAASGPDAFDEANDEIGNTMVRSAVNKVARAKGKFRRDKDSL